MTDAATSDALVRVEALCRRFGAVRAVEGVSFDVRRGEMFGLIGPDGAGKTTTLRMILGLLKPDAGRVATCGVDPFRQRRKLSSRVGYLSQRFSLYGDLTVDENVAFFAEIHDVHGYAARRDALLEMVRMTPFRDRLAERLSGGMKQKLALVCTLVHTPELLVLDEPTTGVDPVSRRDFWKLLARLQREGLTILLTTPYLDEAERCTRVALVDQGRLLTVDAPDQLRATEAGVLVEVVAEPRRQAALVLRTLPGVAEVEAFGDRLHATLPGADPATAAALAGELAARLRQAGIEVRSARPTTPSLEDVFIGRIRTREAAPRGDPMKRVALVLCALPLAPALAAAQAAPEAPAPVRLGVEDAVSRAIAASPRLARLGDLEAAAEEQRRGAAADRWPQVDVGAGYRYRSAVPPLTIFAPTGDPTRPFEQLTVFPNIQNNYQLRAGLALPLYTGGRISGQIDAADKGREAAQQDRRAARADLVLETKTAYWYLVTARAAERVLQEAIKAFEAHLVDARNRERFGMAARNEVLAVEVERDRTELDRLRASGRRRRGRGQPAPAARPAPRHARGADGGARGASRRRERPRAPRQRGGGRAGPSGPRSSPGSPRPRRSWGSSAGGGCRRSRSRRATPTRTPTATSSPPPPTWKDTWDVGASLAWSVFDGGRRSASEARARAQADAARQQLRELDRAIRLEVTQRLLELRTAAQRVSVADARPRGRPREPQGGAGPLPRGRHPLLRAARRRDGARAGGASPAPRPWPRCASPPRASIGRWADEPGEPDGASRRAAGAEPALRRLQGRGPRLAVGRGGRDLRLPGLERRGQVHHDPHALRPPEADLGHRPRARHRRRPAAGGGEEAHRLHEPALQPLRRPHGRPEPALLRRRLRPARP